MSDEPPTKKVRKGTTSCLKCRQRKVKCVWAEGAAYCEACRARNQECHQQTEAIPTIETAKSSSRARIEHLEGSVSTLWSIVRTLEEKLGCVPTTAPQSLPLTPHHINQEQRDTNDDTESDGPSSPSPVTNPPSHLVQLFDNGILGSYEKWSNTTVKDTSCIHRIAQDTHELRLLMPSRDHMIRIATYASSWLYLYNCLFPLNNIMKSSEELVALYDQVQLPSASLTLVATLLLHVAITVHQEPRASEGIVDSATFVRCVSDAVDRTVSGNETVASTIEGIETLLLFLRLQLGRADIKKMWLFSRQLIGHAELLGLHRASSLESKRKRAVRQLSTQPDHAEGNNASNRRKVEVWESLCAIDRISSMMWSLPLATGKFPLRERPLVDGYGEVISQAVVYRLAEIASHVLDLEHIHFSDKPRSDLFNAIMKTDQELRSLANSLPKTWWKVEWPSLSANAILQFWYHYLLVRTHLQLALSSDEEQQYTFNFLTCVDACKGLCKRYISLRPRLPTGFFANRVVDLQSFTGAVFLLLAGHRSASTSGPFALGREAESNTRLVDQVVETMDSTTGAVGAEVARQAAETLRSLSSHLQEPQTSTGRKVTLNLPLIGRIHVSRKPVPNPLVANTQYPLANHAAQDHVENKLNGGSALTPQESPMQRVEYDLMDSLTFSMDIPDPYTFLTDETFDSEQWLTWTS